MLMFQPLKSLDNNLTRWSSVTISNEQWKTEVPLIQVDARPWWYGSRKLYIYTCLTMQLILTSTLVLSKKTCSKNLHEHPHQAAKKSILRLGDTLTYLLLGKSILRIPWRGKHLIWNPPLWAWQTKSIKYDILPCTDHGTSMCQANPWWARGHLDSTKGLLNFDTALSRLIRLLCTIMVAKIAMQMLGSYGLVINPT